MLMIVVALYCEAKPFIEHFNLSGSSRSTKFSIYEGEGIALIVGGTGMIRCAMAATFLISHAAGGRHDLIVNTGICGSVSEKHPIGTAVLFNKITNSETKRDFYPDILFKHDLFEGSLVSFSHPVFKGTDHIEPESFADMEGAGFMEAASFFMQSHNIYCVKTVSDHLDSRKLEPSFVSQLVHDTIPAFENIISLAEVLNNKSPGILSNSDCSLLERLSDRLMLSETMRHELRKSSVYYIRKHKEGLECLLPYIDLKVNSKIEGKKIFENIRNLLAGKQF